jgi:hypothetical protein
MLTEARVDAIFKEMDTYVLELASEPSALGPQYFQDIIALCRGHLNKVSLVVSELNREKLTVSSELRKLEAVYALDYDNLLANDDRVKTLANIDDRKSTVGFILRGQKAKINELKDRMHSLDAVSRVVAYRNRELHATMTAIKDQRRLMQTELSTGAFYGDERGIPKSQRTRREAEGGMGVEDVSSEALEALMLGPSPEEQAEAELAAALAGATGTPEISAENVAAEPQAIASSPVPVDPTEAEILRFLEGGEPSTPQAVVVEPKHEEKAPPDPQSDVDEFLSMLEGV